jgi:twinkle protein
MNELEVFTFHECGKFNTISLFGGETLEDTSDKTKNKMLDFLSNIEDRINLVKKVTLALPNTDKGNMLRDELLRRIGKERCWIVQPPETDYCWNDILVDYGKQKLLWLLDTAKPIPVRGIFDIDDVEDKLDELYYKGLRKGYSTGFNSLDEYYTVVPGQWTIVTGIPGHGKSNILDGIMVNLAKDDDWRFGIFSPENQPIARHFASIMEKYHEAPFDIGRPGRITEEQKENGKKWLKEHFSIILPDEDDNWSIDGVLELAKVLVYRKGMKGLVIDPWNELDHSRPSNQTETEYVSSVLTKIRQFARNYDVHVWLVAHPAKLYKDKDGKYPVPTPYDISGSAHYRNKADNAITAWRNVGHDDQTVADIHIQKIRFKEVGKVGLCSLRFDPISGCYIDDIDQSKRRQALEEGIIIPTDKLRRSFY